MTEKDVFQQISMHITKINLKSRATTLTLHTLDRQTCLFTNYEWRYLSLTTTGLFSPCCEMEASERTDHRLGPSEATKTYVCTANRDQPAHQEY